MADYIQQSVGAFELPMNTPAPLITSVSDTTGRLSHREGSGTISLAGCRDRIPRCNCCNCCNNNRGARYLISFNGNIAVPTGGTVGEIAVAFTIDGETEYTTISKATPAAVENYFSVSASKNIILPRGCCCENVAVENVSSTNQNILVDNLNVTITPAN